MLGLFLLSKFSLHPAAEMDLGGFFEMSTNRKKKSFTKDVGEGVAKGLGKLATRVVTGVGGELASIMSLEMFRPPQMAL